MRMDSGALAAAGERGMVIALGLALLGAAWALDPGAEAAFDAPKRLIVLSALTLAGIGWLLQPRSAIDRWPWQARAIVALMLLALGAVAVSAWCSPQPTLAWDALRVCLLYALWLVLGASAVVARWRRPLLLIALLAVASNALMSLVQAAGWPLPITVSQLGGRFPTGALLGNEGYVALACALLGAAAFAHALATRRWRSLGWLALAITTIAVNRQLTSALALGGAMALVLAIHLRGRPQRVWLLALLLAGALTGGWIATRAEAPTVERVQQLTTYRLAGWAAAVEMIQARPWTGFGLGSYARESQRMRLAAELRWQQRLPPPPTATTFAYAHQEYLQLAAECGLPALACVLAALALLLWGLCRQARAAAQAEALQLVGVLSAGAIAALAWFPLQIPLTAGLLLLAAGRGVRLLIDQESAR